MHMHPCPGGCTRSWIPAPPLTNGETEARGLGPAPVITEVGARMRTCTLTPRHRCHKALAVVGSWGSLRSAPTQLSAPRHVLPGSSSPFSPLSPPPLERAVGCGQAACTPMTGVGCHLEMAWLPHWPAPGLQGRGANQRWPPKTWGFIPRGRQK